MDGIKKNAVFLYILFLLPCLLQAQSDPFTVTPDFFAGCHEMRMTYMDMIDEIIDNNSIFMNIDVTIPLGFDDHYIGPWFDYPDNVYLVPYSGFSLVEFILMAKSPLMNNLFHVGAIFSWSGEWLGMGNDRSSKYSSIFVGGFFDIPGKLRIRCGTSVEEAPVAGYDPVSGYDYFSADGNPEVRYLDAGINIYGVGFSSIYDFEANDLLLLGAAYAFELAGFDISSMLKYFGHEKQAVAIIDIEKQNFPDNVNISGSIALMTDLPVFSYIQADAGFTGLGQLHLQISANYIHDKGEAKNVFGGKIVLGYKPKHLQSENFRSYYYIALSYNDIGFLSTWSVPGDIVFSIGSSLSADPW